MEDILKLSESDHTETLDKKEDLQDVIGYLNNWADLVIVRHKNKTITDYLMKKWDLNQGHVNGMVRVCLK